MKKVFIYIGSRDVKECNSKKVIELLIDNINKKSNEEFKYEIYDPSMLNLNNCLGCCNCFDRGICVLDKKDGFNVVKEKIEDSDLLILVSPVYAHNVTGDMKVFIDRLSYWTHILKLSGKKSVSISVSSTNGNDFVNSYLKKILELLGTQVISNIAVTVDNPRMLEEEEFLEEVLPQAAKKILKSLEKNEFKASREQEKYFFGMQEVYKKTMDSYKDKSVEYQYWKNSGMIDSQSFQEFINYKNI